MQCDYCTCAHRDVDAETIYCPAKKNSAKKYQKHKFLYQIQKVNALYTCAHTQCANCCKVCKMDVIMSPQNVSHFARVTESPVRVVLQSESNSTDVHTVTEWG